ncbi:MAG: BolA family protein, partial [Rhizomicrobium sp.]
MLADTIRGKLSAAFAPSELTIVDDSARHAAHPGAVRADGGRGETHFRVRIVSEKFRGLSRVERQRRIHAALAEEMQGKVHALS